MEENSIHKYKIDLSRRKIELLNRPLFSEFRHKNDLAPPIDPNIIFESTFDNNDEIRINHWK